MTQPIRIADCVALVCAWTNIPERDLLSDCRDRAVVRPRQLGMWLATAFSGKSYPQISRRFGREHTTAIAAVRRIEREARTNLTMAYAVQWLCFWLLWRAIFLDETPSLALAVLCESFLGVANAQDALP